MVVNGVSLEWEVFHNYLPVLYWVLSPYSVLVLSLSLNITDDVMKSVLGMFQYIFSLFTYLSYKSLQESI